MTQNGDVTRGSAPGRVLEVESAKAAQTSRFAVAPGCVVQGRERTFRAGEPISHADLKVNPRSAPAFVMAELVRQGHVVELTEAELLARTTPTTARFVVGHRGGVGTKRGIVAPGCEVTANDFQAGEARILQLVGAGYVVDRRAPAPYHDSDFDPGPEAA